MFEILITKLKVACLFTLGSSNNKFKAIEMDTSKEQGNRYFLFVKLC